MSKMETKKRLIDAYKCPCIKCAEKDYDCYPGTCEDFAGWWLSSADAVEVVRCKDCTQWMYEYDDMGLCVTDVPDVDGVQRQAHDFCSYGERKDND